MRTGGPPVIAAVGLATAQGSAAEILAGGAMASPEPLPWPNSTLLSADVADAVAQLRQQPGKDVSMMGSGELVQTLMRRDLVDEYLLLIHPLVLGAGRRLFGDGGPPASLRLVDGTVSTTGVVIATYQPEPLD